MATWIEGFLPFLNFTGPNVLPSLWIGFSIVFTAFWAIRLYIGGYVPCAKVLININSTLNKAKGKSIGEVYEDLKKQLSTNTVLRPLWKKFDESLVRRALPDRPNETSLYSSLDSNLIFNESTLVYPFVNVRLYNAIPGLLTGIGILGTFAGLVIGLSAINFQVDNKPEELSVGIIGLLGGAKVAFSTSVWGIALSIVFSIYEKWIINRLTQELTKTQNQINDTFTSRFPEHWLSDSLNEQTEQTRELKSFNTDIAISIANALDGMMEKRLSPAIEDLIKAVNEMREERSESNIEAIQNLAEEFKQGLTEGTNDQVSQLSQILERVGSALETTVTQSESTQNSLRDSLDRHIDKVSYTITELLGSIQQKQQEVNNETQASLQKILERVGNSISTQQENISQASTHAKEELENQVRDMSNQISSLVGNVSNQTSKTTQEMQGKLDHFSSLIDSKFEEIGGRFQEERTEISSLLEQVNEALEKMESLTQGLSTATEALGQTGPSLLDSTNNLSRSIQYFRDHQDEFTQTLSENQKLSLQQNQASKETLEHMKNALGESQQSWEAYRNHFSGLREDLNGVFTSLSQGLTEYTQATESSVIQYLQTYRDNLQQAMQILSGAISDLNESIEELHENR